MIPRRLLGPLIVVWALVSWGGRIGLLDGVGSTGQWLRIGGSLVTAMLAGSALVLGSRHTRSLLALYAAWAAGVWLTSIVSVLADGSTSWQFKGVHVVLAIVSLWLASEALRVRLPGQGRAHDWWPARRKSVAR